MDCKSSSGGLQMLSHQLNGFTAALPDPAADRKGCLLDSNAVELIVFIIAGSFCHKATFCIKIFHSVKYIGLPEII